MWAEAAAEVFEPADLLAESGLKAKALGHGADPEKARVRPVYIL